jgi:hypothetical protein
MRFHKGRGARLQTTNTKPDDRSPPWPDTGKPVITSQEVVHVKHEERG